MKTTIKLTINVFPFVTSRLADIMEEHKEELAIIEALDSGAVYTLALKTHIGMSIDTFRYFAGWCDKIQVCCFFYIVPSRSDRRQITQTILSEFELINKFLFFLKFLIISGAIEVN